VKEEMSSPGRTCTCSDGNGQPRRQPGFLLYCVIGASGATLDFCLYSLLVKTLICEYQMANAFGYASGTLLSFILNARFNFRVTDRLARRLLSFLCVAGLGWLVSAGLLQVLIGDLQLNIYLAKLTTLIAVVALQYNLNRRFSFRLSV
jgi:putative flippase GtrA